MGNIVMFCILAVVIVGSALLCVTTTKIMRAATFMLFVLFGVAGIYFLLDYTFLGAAQMVVVSLILLKTGFYTQELANVEVPMKEIGTALVGSEKYQYVLPFEFISVFLLACIIGGLVVARKEDKQ